MNWIQAFHPEIAEILGIPACTNPDAILVREDGRQEIVMKGGKACLYENGAPVRGVSSFDADLVMEASSALSRPVLAPTEPAWSVFECFDSEAAEVWKHVLQNAGGMTLRKGQFVIAELSQKLRKMVNRQPAFYTRCVNSRNPKFVPDGEIRFEPTDSASPPKEGAMRFFKEISSHGNVTRDKHELGADVLSKVHATVGFDVPGFQRIGADLGDPLFLAGIKTNGGIRSRLMSLLKKGSMPGMTVGNLGGNKTASDVRSIYQALIKDYQADAPKYFSMLKDAVLAVSHDYPVLAPHETHSLKTWHNNLSGALTGRSSNVTNGKLTAKWVIILCIVAAHNTDLSPVKEGVTAEDLFFWVVYGHPDHLVQVAKSMSVNIEMHSLPAYPKVAFDEVPLRKSLIYILDGPGGYPGPGDDWEENFLQREEHFKANQAPSVQSA